MRVVQVRAKSFLAHYNFSVMYEREHRRIRPEHTQRECRQIPSQANRSGDSEIEGKKYKWPRRLIKNNSDTDSSNEGSMPQNLNIRLYTENVKKSLDYYNLWFVNI